MHDNIYFIKTIDPKVALTASLVAVCGFGLKLTAMRSNAFAVFIFGLHNLHEFFPLIKSCKKRQLPEHMRKRMKLKENRLFHI